MPKCDWCNVREATHDVEAMEEGASCCEKCINKARRSINNMYGPGVGRITKMRQTA